MPRDTTASAVLGRLARGFLPRFPPPVPVIPEAARHSDATPLSPVSHGDREVDDAPSTSQVTELVRRKQSQEAQVQRRLLSSPAEPCVSDDKVARRGASASPSSCYPESV